MINRRVSAKKRDKGAVSRRGIVNSSTSSPPPTGWRRWLPNAEDFVLVAMALSGVYFYLNFMHIPTHKPEDFAPMHRAGQLAARTLAHVEPKVAPGVSTGALDDIIRDFIAENDAIAATMGYRGFSHSSCISVNEVVCHGVPSHTKELRRGDIVNIDVTVIVDGWHGDTSKTFIVGGKESASDEALKLVRTTREALELGLKECRPNGYMGDIVFPIQKHIEGAGYSVVNTYTAHGIGRKFHSPPHIEHAGGFPHRGARLKPGMFFTIEPMANAGTDKTRLLSDGWTVVTADGKLSAQFEHTVGVGKEECEVFTRLPGNDEFI